MFFLSCRFVILLGCLLGIEWAITLSSVFVHILVGILLVLSVQEEKETLLNPGAGIASMHMGNKPFEIPDYQSLPMLQVPAAKEILPTDSFQVKHFKDYHPQYLFEKSIVCQLVMLIFFLFLFTGLDE